MVRIFDFHSSSSLIVLILCLDRAHGYPVQISLTSLCDSPAALFFVLLQDTDLLERLDDLAIYASGSINMV